MTINIDQIVTVKSYVWTIKINSNPKTRKYWLGVKDELVIINPERQKELLENARKKLINAKEESKKVLIISDKSLIRDEVAQICDSNWYYFLNFKVPAWVLTNFETLLSSIKSMNALKTFIESDEFDSLTKKEKLTKIRQLNKVEKLYRWVKKLTSLPDLVVVIDGYQMSKFVDELEKLSIDNIIISSTDFNRWWKDENLVISNVNYYESLMFVLNYILK